ncbi:PAS domain S-box protein [Aggregicoccus sp. 17bor-14]|uniref:CHASE domain-containing protein n=1 Tax=Myxococcaceae TaxID=31 RepID=UPI00129C9129|nr:MULTISPECIES: CHASE domain-containing protein [Myxococcaceae]MBF5045280.1 CHASE domain-containing protein [Simulacricoccus sp. 17bor-14]MRI91021.1 PAS domain S-box protein [Aggregicoccus sp. 17bor-14]
MQPAPAPPSLPATSRPPAAGAWAQPWLPWAVLVAALLLTALATRWSLQEAEERRRARFDAAAEAVVDRLEVRFDAQASLLRGVAGLFVGSSSVTRTEFHDYVAQQLLNDRFPGARGVGYSPRVRPEDEEALVAHAREEGLADFRLWPPRTPGRDRFTVLFLEPLDARNRAALGFDMFSEPTRAEAMARARDTGRAALSGRVELKQEIEDQKQPGFLLYLPLYEDGHTPATLPVRRARLQGFVYAPFRAGDFFERLFSEAASSPVGFEVYDGEAVDARALLYDSTAGEQREAGYGHVRTVVLAGRPWTLAFHARPGFVSFTEWAVRPFVGVLGVLASFALFGLTRARARERARTVALYQSEERFRTLALHSTHLLLRADPGGERFEAPGWEAFTGQPERQMLAGGWLQVVHPEDRAATKRAWEEAVRARRPVEVEYRIVHPDTGVRWVHSRGVPLLEPDGRVREWVASLTDVTERRLREQEAHERAELEQQLIGIVSHDLRTPLSAIAMSAQSLAASSGLDERQRRSVARIASSSARANRMIETLLDFTRARLGRGIPVTPRPTDLREVARHAVEEARAAHPERTLQLHCEGDVTGAWDPERLEQVLGNLLVNALRHGDPVAPVQVRVAQEQGGEGVSLSVHNAGAPIAPEQLPLLFEPFQVGSRESEARGGLGLGLFIVREIVRSHGGRVEVASEAGRGTTFTVHLPRRTPLPPA